MELIAEHFDRHQQLTDIRENLPNLYAQLLSKFEIQKKELIEFKTKAHYWEAQFSKFKSREDELKTEIEELKAQLRKREQQLFGKKSEKGTSRPDKVTQAKPKNKRGQQPGSKGHGRRDYSHLPTVEETVCLIENDSFCSCCGLAYEELSATEDSEVIEIINVKPYCRVIRRKKYKRHCACEKNNDPQILSAPPSERIYPKSRIGISVWAFLLLNKYKYQHPIYRVLEQLKGNGLSLSMGTIIDGVKKLLPLFVPVYDAIVKRSVSAKHWHADETGWKVFEEIEGKNSNRWYLWIFHNKETVVYKIDPSRSSRVLFEHFGDEHEGGILNVDRYSAYHIVTHIDKNAVMYWFLKSLQDVNKQMDTWVHKEFESISLGDRRLNKRAVKMLSDLSHQPLNSIPDACKGWAETKAAYRFFDNAKITSEAILTPHKEATLNRIKEHDRVFLIQDTTELNYSSQKQKEGVGPSKSDNDRTLFLHPSLMVTPERVCLGVYDDHQWHREELSRHHGTRSQNNNTRLHHQHISEKESYRWLLGYHKATEIAKLCPKTHVVMIADRESDIYDIYDEATKIEGIKADWLVRINKNRVLLDRDEKRGSQKLYGYIENLKPCQTIEFQLPKRNGEPGRKVQQELRCARIKLHPPTGRRGNLRLSPVETTVLYAKEINTPQEEKPIIWWLMTSVSISAELKPSDLILWYLCRWDIEIFFRILKSGCQVEKIQLTTPERFSPCLVLYCIIAWRILFLTSLSKIEPNIDCSAYFDEEEWQSAYIFINKKKPPRKTPSLKSIILCIAQMGGYLARKNDSPPGPKAMWQGLSQLYNFLQLNSVFEKVGSYG